MIFDIISSFLKKTDPEVAHSLAIKILKNNFLPINKFVKKPEKNISSTNFGIKFLQEKLSILMVLGLFTQWIIMR